MPTNSGRAYRSRLRSGYLAWRQTLRLEWQLARIVSSEADNREALVPPGGGCRKVWAALPELGKRGVTEVVSWLIVFPKNEKASLSAEEQRAIIKAEKTVTASYRT